MIILLYVPLIYCAACTYFAFFQMKLCDAVALHPQQHSDGSALLFNATYACRFGPPLCFNFLKLLHERDVSRGHGTGLFAHAHFQPWPTYFTQTSFGNMDHIDLPIFKGDCARSSCRPPRRRLSLFSLSLFSLSSLSLSPPCRVATRLVSKPLPRAPTLRALILRLLGRVPAQTSTTTLPC